MEPTTFVSTLLLGIGMGLAAGWALARARSAREHADHQARMTADTAVAQARLDETAGRAAALDEALAESRRDVALHAERLASVNAALEAERLELLALLADRHVLNGRIFAVLAR